MTKMTSNRPYLIRAFYDWIVDNHCTPYLVVDAFVDGVQVPQDYVSDGQIVLNVAPRAVRDFAMDNQLICFNTRFGGVPTDIQVPVRAVVGIYARENGQGMVFQVEEEPGPKPPDDDGPGGNPPTKKPEPSGSKDSGRPRLRVIK